jgi:hypothetical protein
MKLQYRRVVEHIRQVTLLPCRLETSVPVETGLLFHSTNSASLSVNYLQNYRIHS